MDSIENLRRNKPLVHCMTNYVTVNDVANILLACGGSPIMADDISEVEEIVAISNALLINIGTLNERTIKSMIKAGKAANAKNIPVILDPVGAGASALRSNTVKRLTTEVKFAVIKGNMSEVSFIDGLNATVRGVDTSQDDDGFDATVVAKSVANKFNCIVVITGAIDTVSDRLKATKISNGTAEMGKITGTGCMLGAVIGAYIGASGDMFTAAVTAVSAMGISGEIAYDRAKDLGTGSFRVALIDAMSRIDDNTLISLVKAYEA